MATRPTPPPDTVVVAARSAWPFYQQHFAYVCQAGRSFQPVERLAFYAESATHPEAPKIEYRVDNVDWSPTGENHLRSTGDPRDLRIADVIDASRQAGWDEGRYQVLLLTKPGDPGHETLPQAVTHPSSGRGKGFTRSQRYVRLAALQHASTTADL